MSGDDAQRKLEKGKPYIPSLLGEERAKEIYEERGINQGGASQPLEKPGETGSTIKGHWAEAIIRETKGLGLVEDIEQFQPNQAISRAEFAYFLVTALDLKAGDKTPSFIDVTEATPHKEAILRAASLGIIKGRGQGIFAPNDQITRQEAMVMVQRALKLSEGGGSLKAEEIQDILGKFADGQGVSDWAKEAVAYTVQEGLIKGRLDGLIPLGKITRAEGLQIMVRLEDR
ncbi:MAG: S-layer homology domain-containing protein [Tissierellia bacterium]|nr:S-layer homology domain-containing protein [Tissierellia bacterium]